FRPILLCCCGVAAVPPNLAQTTVVIDFDSAASFRDFPTHSEDGFTLTPNIGKVRINNAFAPFSNAAQPSFGFGQSIDSGFTSTNNLALPFSVLLQRVVYRSLGSNGVSGYVRRHVHRHTF